MATNPGDTRTQLLDSALKLIWTKSYGGVSVDEICKTANAKKGSFYHFFNSKAALAGAALEYLWDDLRVALDTIFSPQNPPLERLRMYTEAGLKEQMEMQKAYGHVVGCPFTSLASEQCSYDDGLQEKAEEILVRVERYLASALRDAVAQGSLPEMDADLMAHTFLIYELGAMSLARVKCDLEPLEGMFDIWMRMAGHHETVKRGKAGARRQSASI